MIQFRRAERKRSKLKAAVTGTAGCGKSYSALLIAKGLGEKIAAIDTENGSLSLYSNLVDFDVIELGAPFTPERYIELIAAAEAQGYGTIIIDSLSHEWIGKGGLLEVHDAMPGNSFANWGKITPRHQKLIDAIVGSKCHVIATMRSKAEYLQTEDNGKKKVEKVGLAPQQRDGFDFEFTICLDVQQKNHVASASKDRTGLWDQRFEVITAEHGLELKTWLDGAPSKEPEQQQKPVPQKPAAQNPAPGKQPDAAPDKVEPSRPAAAATVVSPATLAEKIKMARTLFNAQGVKTVSDLRAAVKFMLNRDIEGITDLSSTELDAVIAELQKKVSA